MTQTPDRDNAYRPTPHPLLLLKLPSPASPYFAFITRLYTATPPPEPMSQSELPPQTPQSPGHQFPLDPPHTPQRLVTSDPMSEHPSPPSSSGSNKRIADSEISELVRRAKASRYNNPPPTQTNNDIADMMERDLVCAICSEVMANPVACLDCVHTFCGEFRGGGDEWNQSCLQ